MIVALEGIDSAGKAVQSKLLVDRLRVAGVQTETMSFPNYESETGKLILSLLRGEAAVARQAYGEWRRSDEDHALALQAVMSANRYEQWTKLDAWSGALSQHYIDGEELVIRPRPVPSILVLDRYWLSGLVFGQSDGLSRDWLLALHSALPPAHHLILDLSPEEAVKRRPELRDLYERDREKQAKVREIYLSEWTKSLSPGQALSGRIWRVGGGGAVEEVAERVRKVVFGLIGGGASS